MTPARLGDKIGPLLQSTIVVIALRGLTLLSRFSLTIFIAKYMSLSELGEYGLIAGLIAVSPSALGFGLMNRICRNAATAGVEDTAKAVLQYWAFVGAVYCGLAIVAGWIAIHQGYMRQTEELFALAVTEHFCGDTFILLMSVRRPIVANALMFARLGMSSITFMALSAMIKPLCNVPILVTFMVVANLACAFLFFAATATWPWSRALMSLSVGGLREELKASFALYVNDMLNAFGQYVDRLFVSSYLGLELTGVYVLFWSVGNAMSTLVNNGVILLHRHAIVSSQKNDPAGTSQLLQALIKSTFLSSATLGALGILATYAMSLFLGRVAVSSNLYVLGLITIGFIIRMIYEAIGIGLYSGHQDRSSLLTSFLVLSLTLLLDALAIPWLGLPGAGAVIVAAYSFGALLRWRLVQRWFDRRRSLGVMVPG